jgi:hypothetical protein
MTAGAMIAYGGAGVEEIPRAGVIETGRERISRAMIGKSLFPLLGALSLCPLGCSASNGAGSTTGGTGSSQSNSRAGSTGSGVVGSSSSGGGNNLVVSPDAGTGSGEVMNGECAHQDFDLSQKPAEILIVLDRSASMQDPPTGSTGTSKWDLVVPGVNQVVMATASSVSWGFTTFPEGEGKECAAGSVTGVIPVKIAPANATAVTNAVTGTTPDGNGTPTGDAINAAVTYLKTLTDANPKFILLATDGEPSCAGTTQDSTTARTYAVQAITNAATAGFKTIVIGVATTKNTATVALNDMATAGQMARADTNPLADKFYLASTQDELVQALELITGQVSTCTFDLTAAPPDPSNIAVHVNGTRAPQDTTHMNGWDYTDSTDTEVEVYGSWCDQIKSASANTVNFVLGCPGELVQ